MATTADLSEGSTPLEKCCWPQPILSYFDWLNQNKFEQVAELFAIAGVLVPPFERAIQGRCAIAQYLSDKAADMTVVPIECERSHNLEATDAIAYLIRGNVKTSAFMVNVAWRFDLNAASEITVVRVKLLATLQELIKFR
ncbi:MAG: nuclear transport factor 2 family protein [Cyanobacteria bacterium J06597_16]